MTPPARILAIDWSGKAGSAQRKTIWLAEVRDGRLVRLEPGRTREEVVDHLIHEAERDGDLVVGLDFVFSMPEWFLKERGWRSVDELWEAAEQEGESWLQECAPPFWGRPGKKKPALERHFRRTEERAAQGSTQPKSVFQIGGAGAVGTGSIRGMPALARLRRAGFSVWPFHPAERPLVIEIYPRVLTGPVVKSDRAARLEYLGRSSPGMDARMRDLAVSTEDAFDAAVSGLVMWAHRGELSGLAVSDDPTILLEGAIWAPGPPAQRPAPVVNEGARPEPGCPFCEVAVSAEAAESILVVPDRYPLSPGHTLVVPRNHVGTVFDLPADQQRALWARVADVREELRASHRPDGFTIGVNDGAAAGQTVPHAHVHVIPRFRGDVEDARGGIRQVIPERARYWEP